MDALRRELDRVPGAQYTFRRPTLFTFETPIEIEIAGYDLDALKTTAGKVAEQLNQSNRFADVESSMEQGHPEVQIRFDRERAAALGLAVHEVADRVVSQVRGTVATRYSWRDRKIDVRVRARAEDRASIEDIQNLVVNAGSSRPVPLKSIADIEVNIGPSEIRRAAQQRVALVTANLNYGDLGAAETEITRVLDDVTMLPGVSTELTGQSAEMADSFRSLLFALALAIFLVYLVMASQFESLIHPLVIFVSIPLAAVGAIWALWVTGTSLSVVVFIGLILLAGIVVNNAIVLIDLVNQLRAEGALHRRGARGRRSSASAPNPDDDAHHHTGPHPVGPGHWRRRGVAHPHGRACHRRTRRLHAPHARRHPGPLPRDGRAAAPVHLTGSPRRRHPLRS